MTFLPVVPASVKAAAAGDLRAPRDEPKTAAPEVKFSSAQLKVFALGEFAEQTLSPLTSGDRRRVKWAVYGGQAVREQQLGPAAVAVARWRSERLRNPVRIPGRRLTVIASALLLLVVVFTGQWRVIDYISIVLNSCYLLSVATESPRESRRLHRAERAERLNSALIDSSAKDQPSG